MKFDWRHELPQIALIVAMFIASAWLWNRVPDEMPVHWNLAGEADRFGSKAEGLLVLPIVSAIVYLVMLLAPLLDPGRANYPQFRQVYSIIRLSILAFMAVIFAASLVASFSEDHSLGRIVPLSVGALFVVLGNYLGKIRPNWFVGIRTPWTLSSKQSWSKTHRLGGVLFVLMGLGVFAFGLTGLDWVFYATLVLGAVSLVTMVVYSYVVFRNDPDRISPADTVPVK